MICEVCGIDYDGGKCPVCGFMPISGTIGGELSPEKKAMSDAAVANKREEALKDIRVYAIGYIMQERDGKLVLDSSEEILLADNIHKNLLNQIYWSPIEYGKETPGEEMQVDVIVKTPDGNKEHSLSANGPDTSGFWKLGFVLKPGFNFALAVGDENNHAETNAVELKG